MSPFAVVYRPEDLPRTCDEISAFLSFRCTGHWTPGRESLLGIWLNPPAESSLATGATAVPPWSGVSRDSIGMDGIWSLHWLKSGAACRLALVGMLLDGWARDTDKTALGRFIPVFPDDLPAAELQAEADRLWRYHPRCVLPPLWQHSGTGRVLLPHDYVASTELIPS